MEVFLPKGTRDYLPERMAPRLAVLEIVRNAFSLHGFLPLDTPAFERIETLEGKYGEEGGKLIFRILERGEGGLAGKADLALRYDLTVPLARVIAMNPAIRFPFRRWQIAPVWRADRPARGRFREFLQCDCDVVGAPQGLADAECLAVADRALVALGFDDVTIRINDRRLLRALAAAVGAANRESELLVAVDKLDKVGREGVSGELGRRGFPPEVSETLWSLIDDSLDEGGLDRLAATLSRRVPEHSEQIAVATAGLKQLIADATGLGVRARLVVDSTLARGLDYYTGPVWELVAGGGVGTIAAGGRYDGLIGMFSNRAVAAVGISLGLERILTILEEAGRMPRATPGPDVVVCCVEESARPWALEVVRRARSAGIATELWVGDGRLKAAMKHADNAGARFAALVGGAEVERQEVTLKTLATGTQQSLSIDDTLAAIVL